MDNIDSYLKENNFKRPKYKGKYTKKAIRFMQDEFILGNTNLRIDKTLFLNPLNLTFEKKKGRKTRRGYILLPENDSFYSPFENDDGATLKNFLKNKDASGLNRLIIKVNNQIIFDNVINITPSINGWWKDNYNEFLIGDSDNQDWLWSNGPHSFILSPYEELTQEYFEQAYRDNKEGLCFFNPIIEYFEKTFNDSTKATQKKISTMQNKLLGTKKKSGLIEKYKYGVNHEQIKIICNELNIGVSIQSPLSNDTLYEYKPTINPRKIFRYINTRLNHLENNLIGKYDNIFFNENIKEVSRQELNELYNNKEYNIGKKDRFGISSIYTQQGNYTLFNENKKILNDFKKQFKDVKFNISENENLRSYIDASLHFPSCFDCIDTKKIKDTTNIRHIDQKKSYSQSKKSMFYSGFLGDIQQFIKIDNNDYSREGLYYITDLDFTSSILEDYNKKFTFFKNNQIYPKPDLKLLNFYNVKFNVVYGLIGSTFDFNWSEDMLNKQYEYTPEIKVPLYSKFIGSLLLDKPTENLYFKGTKKHLQALKKNDINIFYDNEGNEALIQYNKKKYSSLKHITSYILAYQRGQMIQQLLNIPLKNIIRVVVDGIYYYNCNVKLVNEFRIKTELNFKNFPDTSLYTFNEEIDLKDFGEYREYNRLTLMKGEGGNGKTYKIINDKGLLNVLFVSPSWLLSSDKKKEFENIKFDITTHYHLLNQPHKNLLKNKYSNIIIDEVSMLTYEQIESIKEYFDRENIYFCGDIGFQLPPIIKGKEIQDLQFNKVIKLTENFRFKKGDKIINLTKWLRNQIEKKKPFDLNKFYEKIQENKIINVEQLKQKYNTNQLILCSTNKICNQYTLKFKDKEKYIVKKNYPEKSLYNGEIIFDKKENIKYELRHGFTIHIIQGKTAKDKIYIDLRHIRGWRMLYTAISRAKSLEQLFFINP